MLRLAVKASWLYPIAALTLCCSSEESARPHDTQDAQTPDAGVDAPTSNDSGAEAQAPSDMSEQLAAVATAEGLPALAAMVWKDGQIVAQGVTGVRKLGDPTPATLTDRFHLGSDTKAMTATLAGSLIDSGSLSLTDTLAGLFAGETVHADYQNVTLRQVLEHRGGFPPNFPSDLWQQMWNDAASPNPDPATAREAAVKQLIGLPAAQPAGTFVYSNSGYVTLGVILQLKSGKSWEALMHEKLFNELQMPSCGFGPPGKGTTTVEEPWGHKSAAGDPIPVSPDDLGSDNPPASGPAGTAHCTLADWGKFLELHRLAAQGQDTAPVSQPTLLALQTPEGNGDYAGGWGVGTLMGVPGTVLTHDGSNTFWYARALIVPARGVSIAIATNRGGDTAESGMAQVTSQLVGAYAK